MNDRHTRTWCGLTYRINIDHDEFASAPWVDSYGHGPVSEWTGRDKRPGELVLCKDRYLRRYYDYAEACRIALRDRWGAPGCPENATARQRAAHAARADYEYLRGWCNNEWYYVHVYVALMRGEDIVVDEGCGGVSSDDDESIEEFIMEAMRETARATERALLPVPTSETPVRVWIDEPGMRVGETREYDGVRYVCAEVRGHPPPEFDPAAGFCGHCPATGRACGAQLCTGKTGGRRTFVVREEDMPILALRGNLE